MDHPAWGPHAMSFSVDSRQQVFQESFKDSVSDKLYMYCFCLCIIRLHGARSRLYRSRFFLSKIVNWIFSLRIFLVHRSNLRNLAHVGPKVSGRHLRFRKSSIKLVVLRPDVDENFSEFYDVSIESLHQVLIFRQIVFVHHKKKLHWM